MNSLETALMKANWAIGCLNEVKQNAANEIALLYAYGDLEDALRWCRLAFRELGYADPDYVEPTA
jgi:hypothetical protein